MIELQEGEHVVLKARKRWFALFSHALTMAVIAVFPVVFISGFGIPFLYTINAGLVAGITGHDVLFYSTAWILFVWVMFVAMWTNYYMDVLIITNQRLIDMEQFILFSREEVSIPLDKIQDITIEIKGVLQTMFKFGRVEIQTAGTEREAVMEDIKDPEQVKRSIDELLLTIPKNVSSPIEKTKE
ncbi:MAG: PH domain-containing protein [Candidatus Andersenbacteria bacterium]